tara:strand:- start:4640 stop:4885 length:246 start_codon:yes stop_codon:yes gene_type:complete
MARKTSNNKKVNAEDFITAWQQADSVEEVSERLGMSKSAAMTRASNYRRVHEIPLKKFYRSSKLDKDKLRALAVSLATHAK